MTSSRQEKKQQQQCSRNTYYVNVCFRNFSFLFCRKRVFLEYIIYIFRIETKLLFRNEMGKEERKRQAGTSPFSRKLERLANIYKKQKQWEKCNHTTHTQITHTLYINIQIYTVFFFPRSWQCKKEITSKKNLVNQTL